MNLTDIGIYSITNIVDGKNTNSMKIEIGGVGNQPGWVVTQINTLNLLKEGDWQKFSNIKMLLAEHVWEHLSRTEAQKAAEMCYKHLSLGGHLRVAVPDGYHPDTDYIEYVRPGGSGVGADDHKILYTYKTLAHIFESVGFNVTLLEYWDEDGEFHHIPWDVDDGRIRRSLRFDPRNTDGQPHYTSIILDARKI